MDSSWKHRSRDPEAAVNIFRLLTTVVQGKETPAFFYPDSGGGKRSSLREGSKNLTLVTVGSDPDLLRTR